MGKGWGERASHSSLGKPPFSEGGALLLVKQVGRDLKRSGRGGQSQLTLREPGPYAFEVIIRGLALFRQPARAGAPSLGLLQEVSPERVERLGLQSGRGLLEHLEEVVDAPWRRWEAD